VNKSQIYAAFDSGIAKTAIVRTDGEPGTYLVRGKFAEVEPLDDGTWDVWITDTSSPAATLGTRKVNNILSAAQNAIKTGSLKCYDGEASFPGRFSRITPERALYAGHKEGPQDVARGTESCRRETCSSAEGGMNKNHIPLNPYGNVDQQSSAFVEAQWRVLQHNLKACREQADRPLELYKMGRNGHVLIPSTDNQRTRR
jgi:hypothetical protein